MDVELFHDHDLERFQKYFEIQHEGKSAFKLQDGTIFILDQDGGWTDENDCYYDANGQPAGWYYTQENQKYFYNLEGFYIPEDRNPLTLPKHSQSIKITTLDFDNNFLDTETGCYYDNNGEPLGWKLLCSDGQTYFFDLNGEYVEIAAGEEKNDLNDFDLGGFKQEFRSKAQFIKQTQRQRPKQYNSSIIKPQNNRREVVPQQTNNQTNTTNTNNQQKKVTKQVVPQQKKQIMTNNNKTQQQQIIYHFELPDEDKSTLQLLIDAIKEKIQPKPDFVVNKSLITVKCQSQHPFLEMNIPLSNGKVANKK